MRNQSFGYSNITSANTYQVKSGLGRLVRIVVNTPVASSTIKVIDNTSGTTANIATITNTTDVKPYFIDFDLKFSTGLRIVTSGADNITVIYE